MLQPTAPIGFTPVPQGIPLPASGGETPLPRESYTPGPGGPVVVRQDPPAERRVEAEASASRVPVTLASLDEGPDLVRPRSDQAYSVTIPGWGGQEATFQVRFSQEAVELLQVEDAAIHLTTGQIVPAHGPPRDFMARTACQTREGSAPAWVVRHRNGYGIPVGEAWVTKVGDGLKVTAARVLYSDSPVPGEGYFGPSLDDRRLACQVDLLCTPEFTAWAIERDVRFDRQRGELILDRDRAIGLGSEAFRSRYLQDTGKEPPLLRYSVTRSSPEWGPLDRPVTVLRADRNRLLGAHSPTDEELSLLSREPWMSQSTGVAPDVGVVAPTPEAAALAQARFEEVCGAAARALETEKPALLQEQGELERLAQRLEQAPSPELIALAAPPGVDSSAWTAQDALNAVRARRERIATRLLPVLVFVVPPGKHFTSLPVFDEQVRGRLRRDSAGGACLQGSDRFYVFVGQDALQGGPLSRHEFVHLLDDKYLTDSERSTVDRAHRELSDRGGPFPNTYAIKRSEFLTTMDEELQGHFGPDGP
ncbi:MAG: hypothetical protein AB1758_31610, partial [Candidatus Eremiobacterota bacterium]